MSPKLLAVDDDPDCLEILQAMLEHLGCEVLALSDSRQAANRVNHEAFDGVFLDAHMPHIDGFELTRHIRQSTNNHSVPIVMLSGSQDLYGRSAAVQEGVTLFVGKPFDLRILESALTTIIPRAELEK